MVPELFLSLTGSEFKSSSPHTFNDVRSWTMRHTTEQTCPQNRGTIPKNKRLRILSVTLKNLCTIACYFSSAWLRSSSVVAVWYDPLLANMLRGKWHKFVLVIRTLLFDKCWNGAPLPRQHTQHKIRAGVSSTKYQLSDELWQELHSL
jgi:hypothetical protein